MTNEIQKCSISNRPGQILVADDDAVNRRLYCEVLEDEGHSVVVATDGAEALEKAFAGRPDVILLDVTMPKLDGFEVCRQLRNDARTAHIPILIITALATQSDRLTGIQAGANDFLTKPVDIHELQLRVRNAVYQQWLYKELQARYRELKEMAELRESLTTLIDADTKAMSVLMQKPEQLDNGGNHGAN